MIDLTDPDYDGPWTGDQAPPEQDLHPAVRGMLAVRYVDRNGRVKMPTFVGPDATQNAWSEFERRDAHALEFDRERPRIMRWNGAKWQPHHEPAPPGAGVRLPHPDVPCEGCGEPVMDEMACPDVKKLCVDCCGCH